MTSNRPRQLDSLAAQRAQARPPSARAGSTPTARAAASAASALRRMWAELNGSSQTHRSSADVAARAEGHDPQVRRAGAHPSSGSSTGTTAVAPGRSPTSSSAFAAAIASSEPSSSRCTGPMLTMTPTSGSAIATSSAIWPGAAHRHLEHEHLGADGSARGSCSGRPISVLRFCSLATTRRAVLGEHRGEHVLRRRLAGRAGDRRSPARRARGARSAPAPAAPRADRRRRAARPAARSASLERVLGRDEHAPGAGVERCAGEAAAVDVAPRQADEQVAGLHVARVDRDAQRARPPAAGAQRRGAATSRTPAAAATRSGDQSRTQRLAGDGRRRRTAACARPRTPGPARGPCRR